MAKILSVNSRSLKNTSHENIVQQLWDWFFSLDRFWRFSIVIMLIFLIAVPMIVNNTQIFTSHAATSVPPDGFGVYESCSPTFDESSYNDGTPCLDNLATMAAGGFKLVVNYGQLIGSAGDELQYLETARGLGMKVIFALNNPNLWNGTTNDVQYYSALAKTCSTPSGTKCTTNTDFITYVVNLVKNNPALWGYYVGDEVPLASASAFLSYANLIHQLDPSHPRLLVFGTQSTSSSPQANPNWSIFANGAEVIGQDWYPLGDSAIGTMSQAGQLAQSVQAVADSTGKQTAFVLQQMSWQEYYPPAWCTPWPSCAPFPTFSQLQQMINDTLHNAGPRLVLYYSFFDMWGPHYAKVAGDVETAQGHWNDLSTLVESFYITPTPTPGPTTPPTSFPTTTPQVTIIQWPLTQPSTPPAPPPRVSVAPYHEAYHPNPNEYVKPQGSTEVIYPTLAVEPLSGVESKTITGKLVSFIFSINDMISGSVKNFVFMLIRPTIKH